MQNTKIIALAIAAAVAILGIGSYFTINHNSSDTGINTDNQFNKSSSPQEKIITQEIVEEKNETEHKNSPLTFTHFMFDPQLISHITPLGELNGGYEEYQAIAGVMINIKPDAIAGGKQIEVRAPTDMTLESYAYYRSPNDGQTEWALIFRVSPDVVIKFDHISRATQDIIDATTTVPKDTSATSNPKRKVSVKAGDIIGYTHGTVLAHNWNIYMTDKSVENNFIKSDRYKTTDTGRRMRTARCPFDFYPEDVRSQFMSLMGYSKAGESESCGSVSRDVAGTISGMWHFSSDPKEGISEQLDGMYASPLYIIKNSAGQVTIDQVNSMRLDIYPDGDRNKDPKEITTEYCYQLQNGYAYFKLVSSEEMKFAYNSSGSCPSTFPASDAKIYYR